MARPTVWLATLLTLTLVLAVGCGGDPVPDRMRLTPDAIALDRGMSTVVTAFYVANESSSRAGGETVWTSADPTIATVRSANDGSARVDAVGVGQTMVTVAGKDLSTGVMITVGPPAVTTLTVAPMSATLAAGLTAQLDATAALADGATEDVTDQVTWRTLEPAIATVDDRGLVTAVGAGAVPIEATLRGVSARATITVTPARLTAIAVTPASPSVAIGRTVALAATGTYTDATTRDLSGMVTWTSSVPPVAAVDVGGTVTATAVGMATVTAAMGTVRGMTTVTVTPAELVSLAVTPALPSLAAGQSQAFLATGTFSDASTLNLTTAVTWTSTMPAIASISNAVGSQGRATAIVPGNTTIRATMGAVIGETSVTVTPAVLVSIAVSPAVVSVALGRTQAFTATGTFSDASTQNLTASATWSSLAQSVATVSNVAGSKGVATTRAIGSTSISASSGTVSGTANIIVGPAALETITVTPADGSLPVGATRAMHAVGGYSDGTTPDITATVTWTSSTPAVATITAAGVARGVATGMVTLRAQQGPIMGSTGLTVTPPELVSIAVTPANPTVIAGLTQQFTATGTYTDASTANLTTAATWTSSAPAVASISNAAGSEGVATTLAGGTATVTATVGALVGSTLLTSAATTVGAFSPADGATAIRPTTSVAFTFTQPMMPASLISQDTDGPCAGTLQLSRDDFATCLAFTTTSPTMSGSDTIATLTPVNPLRALGRYRLRVTTGASAASGITLAQVVTQAVPFVIMSDGDCAAELVISQVYGGGGNAGAPVLHDFVELHNPGPVPVDLGGKALQFASAAGTAWTVQALPNATIAPGGYFLVREAAGAGAQPALADPDFVPMSPIAMGASAGKIALTVTTTPLAGACPLAGTLDLVGYGGTASCFEGAAPVASPANATSVIRASGGCIDHNVAADFAVVAPAPRNGLTPPAVCVCYVNETDLEAEVDYCNLQFPPVTGGAAPFTIAAVYGRVFEAGVTEAAGAAPQVRMSVGYGPDGAAPATWTWLDAAFNVSVGNDDEYQAPITLTSPGDYDYGTRATRDGTNWTVCDLDGAGANPNLRFDQFQTGAASVTP